MSEIRLVTSSDEHIANINPGYRKDDYRGAILDKLRWQGQFASKVSAHALIRGGDFFHVKEANKTTMATLSDAAAIHAAYPCPTYALAGNHDMSHNDPSSIPRQPLGVLLESRVFRPLQEQIFQDGSLKVRVVGVEYTTDLDYEALKDKVRKRPDDVYVLAVVHALAAFAPEERVQSFFNERVFDYRDLVFDGCPDAYVFGHYHKDQGIKEHMGVHFANLGAISRGALTFENIERKPKVGLFRFDSRGVTSEEVIVPHADASKVFDMEKKRQVDVQRRDMSDFIMKLRADAKSSSGGSDEIIKRMRESSEYPDDLKDALQECMEAAEAGLDDE
jgi:DNA repair exonuclease SbcCD nuclease subunit